MYKRIASLSLVSALCLVAAGCADFAKPMTHEQFVKAQERSARNDSIAPRRPSAYYESYKPTGNPAQDEATMQGVRESVEKAQATDNAQAGR